MVIIVLVLWYHMYGFLVVVKYNNWLSVNIHVDEDTMVTFLYRALLVVLYCGVIIYELSLKKESFIFGDCQWC